MSDRPRPTAPERLRGAIVGFGFIAETGHVPAYRAPGPTRFEIAAVSDTCPGRREKAKALLPSARIYAHHEQLLEQERGRCDFVDICTPPYVHTPIAAAALASGFHVLCEKPLAMSGADGRTLANQARRAHRVLFPCHNYRHAPVVKTVRRVLDAGLIGTIQLATLQTFRSTHAKGVDEWRRDWRRERHFSGGGIAMDHGSHTFYLAFDWFDAYPTSITAKMSATGDFDTEDNFACAMTFPSGTATAHLSWTAGVRKVIYTLHGTKGAVVVLDDDVEVSVLRLASDRPSEVQKEKVASHWMDASHANWFRSLFHQFAEAIASDDWVSGETERSVRCVELISSAYASAREGSRERPAFSD